MYRGLYREREDDARAFFESRPYEISKTKINAFRYAHRWALVDFQIVFGRVR